MADTGNGPCEVCYKATMECDGSQCITQDGRAIAFGCMLGVECTTEDSLGRVIKGEITDDVTCQCTPRDENYCQYRCADDTVPLGCDPNNCGAGGSYCTEPGVGCSAYLGDPSRPAVFDYADCACRWQCETGGYCTADDILGHKVRGTWDSAYTCNCIPSCTQGVSCDPANCGSTDTGRFDANCECVSVTYQRPCPSGWGFMDECGRGCEGDDPSPSPCPECTNVGLDCGCEGALSALSDSMSHAAFVSASGSAFTSASGSAASASDSSDASASGSAASASGSAASASDASASGSAASASGSAASASDASDASASGSAASGSAASDASASGSAASGSAASGSAASGSAASASAFTSASASAFASGSYVAASLSASQQDHAASVAASANRHAEESADSYTVASAIDAVKEAEASALAAIASGVAALQSEAQITASKADAARSAARYYQSRGYITQHLQNERIASAYEAQGESLALALSEQVSALAVASDAVQNESAEQDAASAALASLSEERAESAEWASYQAVLSAVTASFDAYWSANAASTAVARSAAAHSLDVALSKEAQDLHDSLSTEWQNLVSAVGASTVAVWESRSAQEAVSASRETQRSNTMASMSDLAASIEAVYTSNVAHDSRVDASRITHASQVDASRIAYNSRVASADAYASASEYWDPCGTAAAEKCKNDGGVLLTNFKDAFGNTTCICDKGQVDTMISARQAELASEYAYDSRLASMDDDIVRQASADGWAAESRALAEGMASAAAAAHASAVAASTDEYLVESAERVLSTEVWQSASDAWQSTSAAHASMGESAVAYASASQAASASADPCENAREKCGCGTCFATETGTYVCDCSTCQQTDEYGDPIVRSGDCSVYMPGGSGRRRNQTAYNDAQNGIDAGGDSPYANGWGEPPSHEDISFGEENA